MDVDLTNRESNYSENSAHTRDILSMIHRFTVLFSKQPLFIVVDSIHSHTNTT